MELGIAADYRSFRLRQYARFEAWAHAHESAVMWGAALVLALATGALAQISLVTPLTPVPYTGQVLGVALMGGLLGKKWGTISALLYVGLGLVGVPVFAGQVAAFETTGWDRGWAAITGLTGGYLVGFVVQAHVVGRVRDLRTSGTRRRTVALATGTGLVLAGFILLDAYALSRAASTAYYTNDVQAVFLGLLVGGEIAVLAAVAWVSITTKARRERMELFMANVLGLLALYAAGFVVFYAVSAAAGEGLGPMTALRLTVLPFIPVDITKILLAVGLLTLVRPTRAELGARAGRTEVPSTDV